MSIYEDKDTFNDGIRSTFNALINRRAAKNTNQIDANRVDDDQLRQTFRTGLGRRIVTLKAGHALKNTISFNSTADKKYYDRVISREVKRAAQFMLGFGRGVLLLFEPRADLSSPFPTNVDKEKIKIRPFSGDMITTNSNIQEIQHARYQKPVSYQIRGNTIHWTRVIDFTYILPVELDLPAYRFGGISEFELIRDQMINDGVVERACPRIIDNSSSLFYKIKDFKDSLRAGKEQKTIDYFSVIADMRGIYGDGVIDLEDQVEVHEQSLTNLSEVDQITLRRLAMVTGIPLTVLVGESPKGLNATGDNELRIFQDTIETLQSEFLLDRLNELMRKLGMGEISFKDNQAQSEEAKAQYDKIIISNAKLLYDMDQSSDQYLLTHDIIQKDDFEEMFDKPDEEDEEENEPEDLPLAEVSPILSQV